MTEGVIYRYKSPSGKYYIGQTIDESQRRYVFLNPNIRYGGIKIDNARKKYGPENFEYTVLMKITGDNQNEVKNYLNTLEVGFIKMYDSFINGYNSTEGCDSGCLCNETKKKISISLIGHKHSEESRRKISLSKINKPGRPISEETKRKISNSLKGNKICLGRVHKEETKNKIGDKNRGRSPFCKGKHRVYNPDGTYHYE